MNQEQIAILEEKLGYEYKENFSHNTKFVFQGEDGRKVVLLREKDKYNVYGNWPNYHGIYVPNNHKEINVSAFKSIEKIADDINKRFMPWYEEQFKIQLEKMLEDKSREENRIRIKKKFAEILETQTSPYELNQQSFRVYNFGVRSLDITSNSVVIATKPLSEENAEKVVRFIKTLHEH